MNRAVSPTQMTLDDPAARLAMGFRRILKLIDEHPLLTRFLIHAGWPATDQVPAFSERLGANHAASKAQGRFKTSQAGAQALVGGVLIDVLGQALRQGHNDVLPIDATTVVLRGIGIARR